MREEKELEKRGWELRVRVWQKLFRSNSHCVEQGVGVQTIVRVQAKDNG